ncbi:MAG: hypothetical protein ACYTG0_33280 [Planctomycetota bacterium]|jgi:hypothetical protein
MNVKDLQQFLQSLRQPLSTGGAKKAAEELDHMCAGLEPFKDLKVAEFGDFLVKADAYARTGVVPTTGRGKGTGTRRAAKPVDSGAVRTATERMLALYDRVTSPEVDYAAIDAEVKKLGRDFLKDSVLEIARGMGIGGSLKTKTAALDAIRRRMTDRKESHDRTQF